MMNQNGAEFNPNADQWLIIPITCKNTPIYKMSFILSENSTFCMDQIIILQTSITIPAF